MLIVDIVPVGVMHADGLLTVQDAGLVTHHARLMKSGLTVQNEDISVAEVPVHLLIRCRRGRIQAMALNRTMRAFLGCQQLVSYGRALFLRQFILYFRSYQLARSMRGLKNHTKNCRCPSSYSTIVAPGYPRAPVITHCRSSLKLFAVTGSGKVSLRAKTGGMPISLGSMLTSGEITDRAA